MNVPCEVIQYARSNMPVAALGHPPLPLPRYPARWPTCLPNQADVLNTPHARAYERLIRRILDLPQRPAVIVMHAYSYFRTDKTYHRSSGMNPLQRVQAAQSVRRTCGSAGLQ